MLSPKKLKYRKPQRGTMAGVATRGTNVVFGEYGLQSQTAGWVSAREIEAARRAMTRHIRRGGQVWIRIFPNKPITNHGSESVMGSGKGAVDHFVCVVRPGAVLFEMAGVPEELAKEAMRLAAHKLSVRTKFVSKARGIA
ncbi:MAG TPA: 50S ribosomal protein L16 [Verrucomicrobiae bacterium]|nr:50S ribosomal protein L16 [Verrucomicrobiae bacterium]